MYVDYFRSNKVTWKQGIHFKRVKWHSCMKWGWDKIRSGKRLERHCDYFVLSICFRHYGVCWQFIPKFMRR